MAPGAITRAHFSVAGAPHSRMKTGRLSPSHSTVRPPIQHAFLWLTSLTTGSTVYVFGDKKNDHGTYGVVLDNQPAQLLDGVSGCGGAFGQTCEEQIPSIKYLASNLDDSLHTITLVNHAGVNNSFFGMLPLPCPVNLIQYLTYSFD